MQCVGGINTLSVSLPAHNQPLVRIASTSLLVQLLTKTHLQMADSACRLRVDFVGSVRQVGCVKQRTKQGGVCLHTSALQQMRLCVSQILVTHSVTHSVTPYIWF